MEKNLKKIQAKKFTIEYVLKNDNRVELTKLIGYLYDYFSERVAKEFVKYMIATDLLAIEGSGLNDESFISVTNEGKKYADSM